MNATTDPEGGNMLAVADLRAEPDGSITVAWVDAPGHEPRRVDSQLLDRLSEALRHHETNGAVPDARTARSHLGEALYATLDGPGRALGQRVHQARTAGGVLRVVLRLLVPDGVDALHPGARWRWHLASDGRGPVFVRTDEAELVVQLSERAPATPDVLPEGVLRVAFMAFSPKGVRPELDYEHEEELILAALQPFATDGHVRLTVIEDGTLTALGDALATGRFDVLHLSGHGGLTEDGPRLLMEDGTGELVLVSPDELWAKLKAAKHRPGLVMLAACHTSEGRGASDEARTGIASFAARLVALGQPAVVGWDRPVYDDVATGTAAELYGWLAKEAPLPTAVAATRAWLHGLQAEPRFAADPAPPWGTLALVSRSSGGFVLDASRPVPPEAAPDRDRLYRLLGTAGQMRVLVTGFVGRRRELQRLLRLLRAGKDGGRDVAGAWVWGNKGQGKSCLVGRAIERFVSEQAAKQQTVDVVVLHGALSDAAALEAFSAVARQHGDREAEALLGGTDPVPVRVRRLLDGPWSRRRVLIVLDDFEQNVEVRQGGEAVPTPVGAAWLDALTRPCLVGRPKLLVTCTADVGPVGPGPDPLARVAVGPMGAAAVRKLYARHGRQLGMELGEWEALAERLGRNARVLDWARAIATSTTPDELRAAMAEAGDVAPLTGALDEAEQDRLAALYLQHMSYALARTKVGPDALAFVERARVYGLPVPAAAYAGIAEGLAVDPAQDLPRLANLGLVEVAEQGGTPVWRVSPLVVPELDTGDDARWHGVAARWFRSVAEAEQGWRADDVRAAWAHAVAARDLELATEMADLLDPWLFNRGLWRENAALAEAHITAFPEDWRALLWAGETLQAVGRVKDSADFLRRAADEVKGRGDRVEAHVLHAYARVLHAQGDLPGARTRLDRSLSIMAKVHGTEDHPDLAAGLHALASVLRGQGDLPGARSRLERSLALSTKGWGTEEHPSVASNLHELGSLLRAQGDLAGARSHLERSLAIKAKLHGTEDHPNVAASLHELAGVLLAQGDLPGARSRLERSLAIKAKVHGIEEHPAVAASLHELAGVLLAQGDLAGARSRLERSLAIKAKIHGTEDHPAVAASLHALASVLRAQGDLIGARSRLERSLAIQAKVHGTEEHPDTLIALASLATLRWEASERERALSDLERVLALGNRVLGTTEHPTFAEWEVTYGIWLATLGRLDECLPRLRHALAVLQACAPGHPYVAQLEQVLGSQDEGGALPVHLVEDEVGWTVRVAVHDGRIVRAPGPLAIGLLGSDDDHSVLVASFLASSLGTATAKRDLLARWPALDAEAREQVTRMLVGEQATLLQAPNDPATQSRLTTERARAAAEWAEILADHGLSP